MTEGFETFESGEFSIDMDRVKRCHEERDALWSAVRENLKLNFSRGADWPPTDTMLRVLRSMGYPRTEHQRMVMNAWERSGAH